MSRPILLGMLLLALGGPLVGSAGANTRPADRGLDASLRALVKAKHGPPGAIAMVQRGSKRGVHRAGVSRIGTRRRPRATDLMRIASVSKAFSGGVALSLVADGKLRLDDTVGGLLPDLPAAWAPVTLGEALQHTSGLPDFTADLGFRSAFGANLHSTPSPRELLSYVYDAPLRFAPGSRYAYSNSDNFVVALMAEAASGKPFASLLRSRIARPLGLRRTSLPTGFAMPAPAIHGYDTGEMPPEDVTTIASAAWAFASGGIVSTPADVNRFVRGYVGRRLFGRAVQRSQFEFVRGGSEPAGPGKNSAGLGIFRYQTRCGTVYGHTGNTFGYTQFAAATRGGRRSVTVSVTGQFTPHANGGPATVFKKLRRVYVRAACAALAR